VKNVSNVCTVFTNIQFPSKEKERRSVLAHGFQSFQVSKVH